MRKPAAEARTEPSCRSKVMPTKHAYSKLALAVATALSGSAAVYPVASRAASTSDTGSSSTLEEVVVTARKRTENLQDVPISIDVFSSKDLQNLDISQFEDYATKTPSISFISAGPGTQFLVMRGVSDGSNPNYSNTAATGFLVDDMSMNYYGVMPDMHWYDIERIEVLNGPQGTTFGAGAMSGAVRFITNKPDPKAVSAGVDLNGGKIDAGGHNGTIEAFVNLPLIADRTALRLSVYDDYHGGFINNLNKTRQWVNGTVSNNSAWSGNNYNVNKVTGGRIALGQVFSDDWKATLTYSYQRLLAHGAWDEEPSTGGAVDLNGNYVNGAPQPLSPNNVIRFGPEQKQYYTKTLDFHLDGDVGIGDLVYAGTYWAQDDNWLNEYSEYMQYIHTASLNATSRQAFTCLTDPINGAGFSGCQVPTLWYDYVNHTERWSNELRLQSKAGGSFHWLAGVYWERTRNIYSNYYQMPGLQPNGQQGVYYTNYYGDAGAQPLHPGDWFSYTARSDYRQTSEFANVSYDITPKLTVEAGTSHFQSNFTNSYDGGYWYSPTTVAFYGGGSNRWNSKVGISYKVTDGVLIYADAAQGFRDGGVNGTIPSSCVAKGAPQEWQPDSLTNYEIGWKTTWNEAHLVWNGALYYMPWHDLQSSVFDPDVCLVGSFTANIGNAQIYGGETNIKYRPIAGLSVEFAASYNDSHLTTNQFQNPSFQVSPGERLPYVPYTAFSSTVRYERPLKDELKGYAQIDAAYKGDMWNSLQLNGNNGLPRVLQPAYTVANLRFGVNQTESHWTSEFYVTNFTNRNAVIYTNEGNYDLRYTRNEPRVFGLRLSYRFGKQTAGD